MSAKLGYAPSPKCPDCGAPLATLATSMYCPNTDSKGLHAKPEVEEEPSGQLSWGPPWSGAGIPSPDHVFTFDPIDTAVVLLFENGGWKVKYSVR